LIHIKTFSIFVRSFQLQLTGQKQLKSVFMKHTIFLILFLTFTSQISMAHDDNQRITDEKSGKEILIGTVTRAGLEEIGDWFATEYQKYRPDTNDISLIKNFQSDYPFVFIVLGTWCGDSHEQVPRFFKILDQLEYPSEKVFMVAVDRDKKAKDFCIGDYDITLVPTFIITDQGEETGRIIETPAETLERDLLNILRGSFPAPR
jgi:thiol-disulfide isomerase/thioredoxin